MAGIKQPILDILTLLQTAVNLDNSIAFKTVRIWNNQVGYEIKGKLYDFLKPAVFVEVVNHPVYQELGKGFQTSDVAFKIHIVHEFFDAQDGTFEQDLLIFDLRDVVVRTLSLKEVTACSPLTKKLEIQDYEHTNVYHYIVDFVAGFIDSTGSPFDPNSGAYITKNPPTDVRVDGSYVPADDVTQQVETILQTESQFNIPK